MSGSSVRWPEGVDLGISIPTSCHALFPQRERFLIARAPNYLYTIWSGGGLNMDKGPNSRKSIFQKNTPGAPHWRAILSPPPYPNPQNRCFFEEIGFQIVKSYVPGFTLRIKTSIYLGKCRIFLCKNMFFIFDNHFDTKTENHRWKSKNSKKYWNFAKEIEKPNHSSRPKCSMK